MSILALQELRSILDLDPASLRSDQLMDEVFWEALDLLAAPDRERLIRQAAAHSELAREIFGRAEPGPETWRLWYAGQLQGLVGLFRASLGRQLALSTAALVRGRKNSQSILNALTARDFKLSELAQTVDLDKSQLGRELKVLARHNLIETVKEGRERWARITIAGRKALAEVSGDAQALSAVTERPKAKPFDAFRARSVRQFGSIMQSFTSERLTMLPPAEAPAP